MKIVTYTLPGCSHCKSIKELFRRAKVEYTEVVVNKDMDADTFRLNYPGIQVFPFIVIDGTPVGGLVETVKMFVSRGLVGKD